jgi:serine/threonine protein kinase/tetratricopeptide (TPR) repeat protein
MSAEYRKDEEAIFYAAVKLKSPVERSAYLKGACGNDIDLLRRIEALLSARDAEDDFLKVPAFDADTTLNDSPLIEGPGTMVGRYKLLQLIGEGGFGVVYMAEQQEPIRRKVALKIIKLGMDTKQVIARFEAERQALAIMDHPNIARVFDAGATDTGRPYFVMELVKGVPVTEYCDKNNLDTRQRLELFIDVCKAVQHAHQKGIIHRDIKPSNIMITLHDSKPVPKIIDFGIAKATQHRLTEKTLFTEYRQFIGTPEYMSPEQAEMSGLDIDTRTDIYSLGVLLYELLTGSTPFESDKLRSAAYDELRRIIREDEPPRPSTRLKTLGDTLTGIAKHRHAQPGELCRIIRGDLDWVVMKALEKDRTRRYETASELAMDIERHLRDEPVSAGPPSVRYRLHKFVRRHRTVVASGLLVVAAIVGGLVVSTTMYFRAEQALRMEAAARAEAERQAGVSQAVNEFLNKDLLASFDPYKARGREVTVMEILDTAAEKLEGKFKDAPSIDASIRDTLGTTYMNLGKYKAAEPHLERALELRRSQFGGEHPDTLKSMADLGLLYNYQGRYNEAEPLFAKALEIRRRVLGEENPDTLWYMGDLGWLYVSQGRYNEAEPLFVKALEIRRRVLGEENPDTLNSMNSLGELYSRQGRYNEAEPLFVKALEIRRRVLGEEHPDTLESIHSLGWMYCNQGRYNEAEPLFVRVLEIQRRVLGEENPDTLNSMSSLGDLYSRQGRYDEAEPLFPRALEGKRRVLGEEHPNTLLSMTDLGWLYCNRGRYNEAEPLFVKTLEIQRRVLGEEHPDTLNSIKNLAVLVEHLGSLGMEQYKAGANEQAVATLKRVDEYRRTVLNSKSHPPDIAYLAMALHRLGRAEEAKVTLDRLRDLLKDERFAEDEKAKACLAEAEKLISGKKR